MLSIFQRIVSKNRMEYLVVTRDEMYLVLSFILYLVSCILYPASSPFLSSVNLIDSDTVAIFGHTCVVLHMGCLQKILVVKLSHFGHYIAVRLTLLSGWITPLTVLK